MVKVKEINKATKTTTQEIQEKINADKCSFYKRVYKAKWFYFYTHGMTTEDCVKKVKIAFPDAVIVNSNNRWNAWPKESWFEVQFIF